MGVDLILLGVLKRAAIMGSLKLGCFAFGGGPGKSAFLAFGHLLVIVNLELLKKPPQKKK